MSGEQRKSRDEISFSAVTDPVRRALRVQEQAASLNFDWPDARGALAKLREEVSELEALVVSGLPTPDPESSAESAGSADRAARASSAVMDEVGDLLFAAINVARLSGVAPGVALSNATRKFERRFEEMLTLAERLEIEPTEASLEELDVLWERVKRDES